MKLLAIETTGPLASVAFLNNDGELREMKSGRKLSHLQHLIPMIGSLLADSRLHINDVTHIAVSEGPGSFTGIRIGMATAKALAQILGIPVIPVPTLEAMARNVPSFNGIHCPILDARRNQIYAGAFMYMEGKPVRILPDKAYEIDELVAELVNVSKNGQPEILFLGDGIPVYGQKLRELLKGAGSRQKVSMASEESRFQEAVSVAWLAKDLLEQGKQIHYDLVRPVYLRKAEAQRRLDEKLAEAKK